MRMESQDTHNKETVNTSSSSTRNYTKRKKATLYMYNQTNKNMINHPVYQDLNDHIEGLFVK